MGGLDNQTRTRALVLKDDDHGDGEEYGHGSEVEEPLDNVDGQLVGDREAGLFRGEIRTDRIGYAADEGDCSKTDDLGWDE